MEAQLLVKLKVNKIKGSLSSNNGFFLIRKAVDIPEDLVEIGFDEDNMYEINVGDLYRALSAVFNISELNYSND